MKTYIETDEDLNMAEMHDGEKHGGCQFPLCVALLFILGLPLWAVLA